jgi:hypothetical protein
MYFCFQNEIVTLLANDPTIVLFQTIGNILALTYHESVSFIVEVLRDNVDNFGISCLIEMSAGLVASHSKTYDQTPFAQSDGQLLHQIAVFCHTRQRAPPEQGIMVIDARFGACELAICHFYQRFVAVYLKDSRSNVFTNSYAEILLRVTLTLGCNVLVLPLLHELLECFILHDSRVPDSFWSMLSHETELIAALIDMNFPFIHEQSTWKWSSRFYRQIFRLIRFLPFQEGIQPMCTNIIELKSFSVLFRLLKVAVEMVPSPDLLAFLKAEVIPIFQAVISDHLFLTDVVVIVKMLILALGFPTMSSDAIEYLICMVHILQEIAGLPDLSRAVITPLFDALKALFDQRVVNLSVLQLYGDSCISQLITSIFEIVGLPDFFSTKRYLKSYFAFFDSFLRSIDNPTLVGPPVFLHFFMTAHLVLVSDTEKEIIASMFDSLALISGEFALLPVLKPLDPNLFLSLCLATLRFRFGSKPAHQIPPACAPVLIALLRSEAEFLVGALVENAFGELLQWQAIFERLGDPWIQLSEQEALLSGLAIPMKMLLERIRYDAVVPVVDDTELSGDEE